MSGGSCPLSQELEQQEQEQPVPPAASSWREAGREMFSVWGLRPGCSEAYLLADGPERHRKKVLTCRNARESIGRARPRGGGDLCSAASWPSVLHDWYSSTTVTVVVDQDWAGTNCRQSSSGHSRTGGEVGRGVVEVKSWRLIWAASRLESHNGIVFGRFLAVGPLVVAA